MYSPCNSIDAHQALIRFKNKSSNFSLDLILQKYWNLPLVPAIHMYSETPDRNGPVVEPIVAPLPEGIVVQFSTNPTSWYWHFGDGSN